MDECLQRLGSHVTTKARRATEEDKETMSSKRRKFNTDLKTGGEVTPTPESSESPAASGTDSGGSDKHEDYSADTGKRSSDLESESLGTGISARVDRVSSYGESEEILLQSFSTSKKKKPSETRRISRRENSPSVAELEEFFAAAEKYDQKRFAEKYNYDIAGDVPLEGKYQWVELKCRFGGNVPDNGCPAAHKIDDGIEFCWPFCAR